MSTNPFLGPSVTKTSRISRTPRSPSSSKDLTDMKHISYDTQRNRYKVQLNINLGNFHSLEAAKIARNTMIAKIQPWLAKNKKKKETKLTLENI